mmetsp:Transcript_30136/g.78105  ORF Transcript_30136/g.78105 Transcript_30136/m.78105 type:complete len:105 (-) Transcript_30136:166-480(-)
MLTCALGNRTLAVQLGPGCIAWFVIAEIFPAYATDAAMAIGVGVNWTTNALVALAFPSLQLALGPYAFFLFAAASGVFALVTWRFVPETAGRTITQVFNEFDHI